MTNTIIVFLLCISVVACTLTPTRVQLTLNGDVSTMQVTFTTSSQPNKPSVSFWASSLPSKVVDIVANPGDIHSFSHFGTVDYITTITISPLAPATKYSYYVSGTFNDTATKSDTFSFISIPSDSAALNIGIYGDLGAYGTGIIEKGKGGLVYWAQNNKFDFIIHNGDLAYNLDSNTGKTGEEFLANIEPITSSIPYVVTPGNHEFMGDSETYYNNWFFGQTKLGKKSNSSDPIQHYSFDIGSKLHIVVISTEVFCEDKSHMIDQYTWLENDLVEVRKRSVQPWILAFGHRQIYIGSTSGFHSRLMRLGLQCNDSSLQHCDFTPCKSGKNCAYSIEQLFNKYKVDMYFAGHMHTYNRMYPIADDLKYEAQALEKYVNPQHPVYVVSGAAGIENSPSVARGLSEPLASPTAKEVSGYSFSLLTLFNNTHLRLEQYSITSGSVVDSFWIEKDSKQPPWSKTAALTIDADTQLICDQ